MSNPLSCFRGVIAQKPAPYGIPDPTPPTFAGITGATPNSDGSITVNYALASSTKTPIDYHVYIALGNVSAGALFMPTNQAIHIPPGKTTGRVFFLADQTTYLVKDQVYTVGVRSNDVYGFEDSNTAIQVVTAIASGNLPAIFQSLATQLAATEVLLATDHVNFQGDHTNFQADHAAFVADDAAFDADHANFQSDHSAFQGDHSNFQADHSNLAADIVTLNGYLTTLNSQLTTLGSIETLLSADLVTLGDHLSDFAGYLTDLNTLITAFAANNSDFADENAELTTQLNTLSGLISALQIAVGSAAGLGGLEVEVVDESELQLEIIEDEEVV